MRWIVENAQVIPEFGTLPEHLDILVDDDLIADLGSDLKSRHPDVSTVIPSHDRLVIPGLVNAHLHSHDRFDKGRFGTIPLEVWIWLYNPPTLSRDWTPRECYLRTLLSGIELLRSGTTMVIDDVHHGVPALPANIEAVFQAYEDIGIRACVSVAHGDRLFHETVPLLNEILPDKCKQRRDDFAPPSSEWMLAYWRELAGRYQERVRFALSPSAPQRCTDEFLLATWQLSEEFDLPVVAHVLETRVQQMSGNHFYGKSIVEKMQELDLLTRRSNLVHGVWMTESDLDLVASNDSCIVHCPGSNLKLGSGIAPVSSMLERGITVGLGTDNHNANDNANMFESIKLAALVNTLSSDRPEDWIDAVSVLRAATLGGARCALLDETIGSIAVGKQADFVLLDTTTTAFTPQNDIANQLTFCEDASSIEKVVVAGKIVFDQGRCRSIDETSILEELHDRMPSIREKVLRTERTGREMEPYLRQAWERCLSEAGRF